MEWLLGYLPLLLFLACPLMMAFCFFGMRKAGCSTNASPTTAASTSSLQHLPASEQVAALQVRLNQLQTEQQAIAAQIDGLHAATAAPDVASDPARLDPDALSRPAMSRA